MIPYGRQNISAEDIQAVVAVLRSDFLTQGPAIERFERKVADYCGARYAVAVSSATAALHIASIALGIRRGKRAWTSPMTFVASSNSILYSDGTVGFVDVELETGNMSIRSLRESLEHAEAQGTLPDLVIPVHYSGQSCDMKEISDLSVKYGFSILEDASHAIGGTYNGKPVGSCEFSDAAVFSFHPVKIVTTGEGGMILTNRNDLHEILIRLRSHGITRNPEILNNKSEGPWYYEQLELGYNYRITDLQAALGESQMNRLDEFITRRNTLAARYDFLLKDLPVYPVKVGSNRKSAYHLYPIRISKDYSGKSRREIFEELRGSGIGVQIHYIPVHLQPYYQSMGFKAGDYPVAERFYGSEISLPMFYDLSDEDQDKVVGILKGILER